MLGRNFFLRVVRHLHRLRRDIVDALSLEAFRPRLDGPLGALIWQIEALPI